MTDHPFAEKHAQQRARLAQEQADEIHRYRIWLQSEHERRARLSMFRVAAAMHHGITCADVTAAQMEEAQERAARCTVLGVDK